MNVSLKPWDKWVNRRVRSGHFRDASEVLRHCIRVVDRLERSLGPPGRAFGDRAELETLLLEGLDSGPARTMTRERRKAMYAVLGKAR